MNREELYAQAKRLDIRGRSMMNKTELEAAIAIATKLSVMAEPPEITTPDAIKPLSYPTPEPLPMTPERIAKRSRHIAAYGGTPDALKPLSYGDRVRNYAKQNGQPMFAKLTGKQWRRAKKKQNRIRFGDWVATKPVRHG